MSAFFPVATVMWLAAHLYVGRRLFSSWSPPKPLHVGLWLALMGHFTLAPIVFFGRMGGTPGADWFPYMVYIGVGWFVVTFLLTLARDLGALAVLGAHKLGHIGEEPSPRLSRRRFLTGASSAAVLATSASASAIGHANATSKPEVKRVDVPISGLDPALEGLTIVQLSDIHVGPTVDRAFLERVVARVNTLGADLVTITGDLVDGLPEKMRSEIAPLAAIQAKHGWYYVTGNHEYYWDAPGWAAEVTRLGGRALLNRHETLLGGRLVVAGVTDFSAERSMPEHASDPVRALQGAPSDAFKLMLAHQPKSVNAVRDAGADLQLSGHTHGGQFYPFNMLVAKLHPFSHGLHDYGPMKIYVSRGTGYWGPPLRLGAPSEITLLTLRAA